MGTREVLTRGGVAAAGNLPQVTRHGYCPVSILSIHTRPRLLDKSCQRTFANFPLPGEPNRAFTLLKVPSGAKDTMLNGPLSTIFIHEIGTLVRKNHKQHVV